MRRISASFTLIALSSCSDAPHVTRPYEWNDLRLVTAYTAKAVCSCLFVEERTETECAAFAIENPPIASWKADAESKTVDASALLLWSARAHWESEKFGCVLDEE